MDYYRPVKRAISRISNPKVGRFTMPPKSRLTKVILAILKHTVKRNHEFKNHRLYKLPPLKKKVEVLDHPEKELIEKCPRVKS